MQTSPIDWHISIAPSEKQQQEHILQPLNSQKLKEVASWLNVKKVANLEAKFLIMRKNSSQATLKGYITALVSQLCIRSLEPIDEEIQIEIFYHLIKEEKTIDSEKEIPEDDLEYWDGKNLDLGKILSEELLLHINPYPKKIDTSLDDIEQIDTSASITKKTKKQSF